MSHPILVRKLIAGTRLACYAICAISLARADFNSDFASGSLSPAWTIQGDVTTDATQSFSGNASLRLNRKPENVGKECSAISPLFKATPGQWKISLASKSALISPDTSFDGVVSVEFYAGSTVLDHVVVADIFGTHNWQEIAKEIQAPSGTDSARFSVQLNKASGQFWIDDLSATFLSTKPGAENGIAKLYFDSAQVGNLLFPGDSRTLTATVEATKELSPEQLTLNYVITDYWGAEQTEPVTVALSPSPKTIHDHSAYTATVDLSHTPLETGRYYEIHAQVPQPVGEPYRNYTSFAILPQAPANAFPPLEIPFSSRDWDDRIPEYFQLSHRLGIRICCVWTGWTPDDPTHVIAPGIDLCAQLGMGVIAGTPINAIERRAPGYEKFTDQVLRKGTRSLIESYGKVAKPLIIDLGNEPPVLADRISDDVKAYASVYDEAKKTDPSVTVLGTSVGNSEQFFQAGFGKYCDAYDFHIYEDSHNVALALQKYRQLFAKYGSPHPVWSTELGLNSQGVSRHAVSVDMVKKVAFFFANGGAMMSWFDLLYPDPDARNADGSAAAHDVFDSRYAKYAPKLTAITYYNLVNGLLDKQFVAQRDLGDLHFFLFRDKGSHSLLIAWKDKGRQDVYLPLPGTTRVDVTRIDTAHDTLDAAGKGVTLSVDEDPVLMTFDGSAPLFEKLGKPEATFTTTPPGFVQGASGEVVLALNGISPHAVSLKVPPFWQVRKSPSESSTQVRFTVNAPAVTTAREASLIATIQNGEGKPTGELYLRPPVIAPISSRLVPVPASGNQPAALKLVVQNNGTTSQAVQWQLAFNGQLSLEKGAYPEALQPSDAYFGGSSSGSLSLSHGQSAEVAVPLRNLDSQGVYQVISTLTDATGRTANQTRYVTQPVAVPKVKGAIRLDGTLDGADWQKAPVETIDEARQYFSMAPAIAWWKGPADLSCKFRFLWDDKYLYVGAEVTDDIAGGRQEDSMLWDMDGLQFLIDPCRGMNESVGKYDYAMAVGKKGPQAWCSLTADGSAPNGEAKDIVVAYKRKGDGSGSITYELAIPWTRLAPFKPAIDADLGLSMILNEDDGKGRRSFMTWFGNVSTKQVNTVGDLILQP